MSERTHICGGCGSREGVGYLVDATIAALQARVQELEDGEKLYQEVLKQAYTVQDQLTQRTAELEVACEARAADSVRYQDLLLKYQALVAWYDKQNGTPCEQVRHQQAMEELRAQYNDACISENLACKERDNLRAELERVRPYLHHQEAP